MKKASLYTLLLLTLFSFTSDEEVKEYLSVSGPLVYNEKTFNLKWSSKNDNYYIQEYLINDDTVDDFEEMISLFVLNEKVPLKDAAAAKIQELKEIKKTDPVCNYAVTLDADNDEVYIDFLRGESIGNAMTLVEFNLYRYKQITIGKNKKAVLVYAFSKRATGSDILPFLTSLKEGRFAYIEEMMKVELPEIKLTKE